MKRSSTIMSGISDLVPEGCINTNEYSLKKRKSVSFLEGTKEPKMGPCFEIDTALDDPVE